MNESVVYAEIALKLPIQSLFTYQVPEELKSNLFIGSRVIVPFRNKKHTGIVVSISNETSLQKLKSIEYVIDNYPIFDNELMKLAKWISEYYICPPGEALHAAMPPSGRRKYMIPTELLEKAELYERHPYIKPEHLSPTDEQKLVLNKILSRLDEKKFSVNLLYGVTGSGKTEIYLQSIAHCLSQKRNALVLVPEIALTFQLIERFRHRFGDIIAVLHSGLRGKQRLQEWRRIRKGEARVVVGVRSAIFAPVRQLGIIIVDEEHENTYKQENSPKYHARDVAIYRGQLTRATVILGSATPSMESFYKAKTGKYNLLELTTRIDNRIMPQCKLIDLRQEWDTPQGNQIISSSLQSKIKERLENKEQVLLFLNRRGFSTILLCRSCGKAVHCKRCSVPLTFHQATNRAHCHYCGIRYGIPEKCPTCEVPLIKYLGLGTQQVETEVKRLFPNAKIERLDVDIGKKRGEYERILESFIAGDTDILLGTQMIAKGMDIPNVTLVGVINADMMINLSDFRSAERAYALLTQVSGRAGRGDKPGEVLIQTYNPYHYSIQAVLKGERESFYEHELRNRKKVLFPPYQRLLLILIQHTSQKHAQSIAEHIAFIAKDNVKAEEFESLDVIGPTAAPTFKIKKKYRYYVLMKGNQPTLMRKLYYSVMEELPKRVKLSGISISVDVDPITIQ